jgi:hypothetical protein
VATKRFGVLCYDKADPDEPIFVLRAQDALAARTVLFWAEEANKAGADSSKVAEARKCAAAMEKWPIHKLPD